MRSRAMRAGGRPELRRDREHCTASGANAIKHAAHTVSTVTAASLYVYWVRRVGTAYLEWRKSVGEPKMKWSEVIGSGGTVDSTPYDSSEQRMAECHRCAGGARTLMLTIARACAACISVACNVSGGTYGSIRSSDDLLPPQAGA